MVEVEEKYYYCNDYDYDYDYILYHNVRRTAKEIGGGFAFLVKNVLILNQSLL